MLAYGYRISNQTAHFNTTYELQFFFMTRRCNNSSHSRNIEILGTRQTANSNEKFYLAWSSKKKKKKQATKNTTKNFPFIKSVPSELAFFRGSRKILGGCFWS